MKRTMLMLLHIGFLFSITLWPVLDPSPAWAFAASRYQLSEESNYQEGCFDPCMCPILLNETLQGGFVLNLISRDGEMDIYEILEIDWQFIQGDETVQVSGSGLYLIGRDTQSISLDLKVGEGAIQHFESGIVPLQVEFPEISIAAAVNGFFCYDHVFFIAAMPASVNVEHDTWGCLKSTYR